MSVWGIRSPETGITDRCELPHGYWELNSGPLEEQPVLLIFESSLQPSASHFKDSHVAEHTLNFRLYVQIISTVGPRNRKYLSEKCKFS